MKEMTLDECQVVNGGCDLCGGKSKEVELDVDLELELPVNVSTNEI